MNFLTKDEEYELLVTFNNTAVAYSKDKTIVDLFEEQVGKTPDHVAVVFEDSELTYRELNERSNQLANYLQANYRIQPDDLIGIRQQRSKWMMISILGVLKSGGAYVPIDPEYPQERIAYMEEDTQCKVCLDEKELGIFKERQKEYSIEKPISNIKSSNLIYVLYTSGSTGKPKGVMLEHRGLVNRMLWMKRDLQVGDADVFLQKTPITFDVSVWELFLPLVCGSKLVFAKPDGHKDPLYLDTVLEAQKISIVHFVPSMLRAAMELIKWDRLDRLRHVVCSGEALSKRTEESFKERTQFPSLHNYYGPTEASIDVTAVDLTRHPTVGHEVSIGKPVDNTRIYIVNEKNALQPVGVPGEILIGGDQVARGYLNREVLTNEKFIANPFEEGERVYKTGDLGRWLPDGNIEFLGRKDDQVKIRGYRIELGEIESALIRLEGVENCTVLAKNNEGGEASLIAYVIPDKNKAYTVSQILKDSKLDLEFDAALYEMDNGVSMYAYNRSEVKMLYTEVFDLKTYYKHGVVVPKDACIIDVGANVGAFSIFSLLTFENPKIYSFEPLAPIYSLLEKNLSLYNGNVEIFNVGISDKEEEAVFDYYPYATVLSGRHSESYEVKDSVRKFIDNTQTADANAVTEEQMDELLKDRLVRNKYTCQLKTLSQVIRENAITHIDLLKIDVENAELDVINGIAEEDWAKIDQIIVEVYDDNDRLRTITQIVSSYGFSVSAYQSEELKGTKFYDVYCIKAKGIVEGKIDESFKDHWYSTNALIENVRQGLMAKLPVYMVPSEIVLLDNIPLTSNGKIDRKALLQIDTSGLGKIEFVAPRTEQEMVLASVWSDVLKREGVGIRDSFYNLGGDSIKSIQVVAKLRQRGYKIKVEHLLRTPVLEELARLMELTNQVADQSEVSGEVVLTPMQKWFFNAAEIKVHNHFNQSVVLYSREQLDGKIMEKGIEALTRHHDALRMVYKQKEGAWQQFNRDTRSNCFTFDFYDLTEEEDASVQMARLGEKLQSSISIGEGPLFKVAHFRLKDGDRLGLIIHHLVVDGVSWRILLEDLSTLCTAYKEGKKPGLPLKTDSFQRWALLQKEYAASKKLRSERAYWEEVCRQEISKLPQDKVVKEDQPAVIDSSESFRLDKNTTELLQTRVHRVYNTEINDVLLTSLGLALKEVLSADKSVLKMEGHGREEIIEGVDISRTVGWFTTAYPFVLDLSKSSSQVENLVNIKEDLRRVPGKGFGYGILSYLTPEGLENKVTPEIIFNYLGDFGANVSNDGDSLLNYASDYFGSATSVENETDTILDVAGILVSGELGMSIRYSKSRYHAATIKKLAESYKKNLEFLIDALAKTRQTHLTPSDLSFKGLTRKELSKLNSDNNLKDVYELSPLQEGIYYYWLAENSSSLYFEQTSYRMRTRLLDVQNLKRAYDRLIARHAVLRTSFSTEYAGRSLQIVKKEVPSNFAYEKLDSRADRLIQAELIKKKDRERGFDLNSGSQMRLQVIDLAEGEYEFIWSYHHILMDGWCGGVLINDFNELLSAETMGREVNLPPALPYANYINWLRAIDRESSLLYWKNYLSGYSSLAQIPFKSATTDKTYVESVEHLQIAGELFKKVDALCIQLGVTLNTFIQGVWGYLLSRYNNTSDVVFGAVVSGRPADLAGVEDIIGLFSNTIPVRVKYDSDDTPVKLLRSLQEQSIQSTSHHYMNLSEVQAQSELGIGLIDNLIIFENYVVKKLQGEGLLNNQSEEGMFIELLQFNDQNNYDFNIVIAPSSVSLNIAIRYNTNCYNSTSLKCLVNHFDKLINEFAQNPHQSLSTLDYLTTEEKHRLLVTFNETTVAYPKDKTIVDLFEEQALKTPDSIAVVFAQKALTYRELNEKSNQLAHYLRDNYDIKPDSLIGIQLDRSEWVIISILGVLKAGGAYVPIDPQYPAARKEYIVKDSSLNLLITEASFIYDIDYYEGKVFAIDVEFDSEGYNAEAVSKTYTAGNLAYVIYTSGSTGNPKGVMIEHQAIANTILAQIDAFKVTAENKGLQFASFSFDASVSEAFIILLSGASLFIAEESHRKDPGLLTSYIESNGIDIATLSPSYLSKIEISNLKGLKTLITAGESAHYENAIDYIANGTYYNAYGPTETSICGTIFKLEHVGDLLSHSVPIGKPISNTQIYILNEKEELQPVGVAGEIYIGGTGLARGYWKQESLTKEKFIASPFEAGERLYKTGDLGRWLPDGNIEFIGRKDDQVKIRGYRIELGEIEQAVLKHEAINQAVVLAKENQSGEKELVAYITSHVEQNINDLRGYLRERLPLYMLPAHFVQLEAMPLTANGKVDKKSLPDSAGVGLSSGVEYVAPRTAQEKVLSLVWSDVLKREGISIKDSFYNLGGDSIKSIQVVARLKQQGYRLKIEHLLRTPVLEELARLMELTAQTTDQSEVSGEVLLTPIQDWFFKTEEIKVHNHYNQSVLLHSKDQLDSQLVEKSIADLTRHHDALRMVYRQKEGAWQQFNHDTRSNRFTFDFYDLTEEQDASAQMARLGEELQSSISIGEGPLFRVAHFRLKDGDRLGLIVHHLVVDGVSWRILLEDLSTLYSGYKEGKKPSLPLKTDSFQRWAFLQEEYAAGKKLEKERVYWQKICHQQIARLPQDKFVSEDHSTVIDSSESFSLDNKTTELLQTRVHGVYNTEINDVLLTSLGLALKEVLSSEKSVLKMEGHGREEIIEGVDISRTVGWFTTVYPFVLDVSDSSIQIESLVNVKEALRSIPKKGIGYGILTHLTDGGLESKLTPEITFNYLGDFGSNVSNAAESLFEYASERIGSDFSKENTTDSTLDISGMLVKGKLGMSIRYSKSRYHAATIKKLADSYKQNLEFLIEELAESKTTYLTPSDLSFKGLSLEELSRLNAENNLEDIYELSPLQEGIYYHWLSETSTSLYFEQTSYRVRVKALEIEKLKTAYDQLTARHAVLRTSFSTEYAGRSLQIVRKEVPSNFTYEQLDRQADRQVQVELIKQQDRERGFDLSSGSQMRLHVIDLSEGEYEFIWSHHHILMDGWCVSVLINDFNELLSAAIKGRTSNLPVVTPYSKYVNWLRTIDRDSSLSYWKDYLSNYSLLAEIPFRSAAGDTGYVEATERLQVEGDLLNKIDVLCAELGITHNTFVQAVWGYLLSRYNNTNDVVFGAVVSGRPADLPGVEDMIGLFINTVPVRVKYNPDDKVATLLKSLQEHSIQSTSHHYMNLSEVQSQSELGVELMDHIMIFENYAVKGLENEGVLNSRGEEGLSIASVDVFERTNYDFNVIVRPSDVSLGVIIKYNINRYDQSSLKNLIRHFDKLIHEFAKVSDQPLCTIDYLSEEERYELLVTFNDTAVAYSKEKTIVDLFEEQAARTPDSIAVVFEEREMTYRQLNEISNQLAHYLRKNYDIQPDDLIGIKQARSEWMIVSILGVLKSGGAYVPVDPELPHERVQAIVEDSKCKLLLDLEELVRFQKYQLAYSVDQITTGSKPNNIAYVIYTSGSTGKPKGVMIEHQNVINFFSGMTTIFGEEKGAFLAMTNFTFDISVLELLWTLSRGYKVVIQGDARQVSEEDNNNRPLDFSLFYFGNNEEGEDKYKLLMDGAKYADEHGYLAVWTPERHFNDFGGLYPNPSLMAAALSSVTRNIGVRAGSVVLTLHHPIQVAEDWSVIDNLSNGRAGIACASGWHADDFVLAPDNYEPRHKLVFESIDTLRKLWRGESIAFENGAGNFKKTKIFPKPVQEEIPIWVTSAGNRETFISAGKIGANILTHLLGNSIEDLAAKIAAYRKAYAESGHDVRKSKVTIMLHTYIDEEENIEEKARQPFIEYIKSSAGLIQQLIPDLNQNTDLNRFSQDELEAIYEHAYQRFISTSSLVGTKEKCFKMLQKLSAIGIDEIASLIDFGVDYDSAMLSLKRLTELKDSYNYTARDNKHSVRSQIKKHKVTHLQITPSMGVMLNHHLSGDEDWSSIKAILLGGEPATTSLVNDIYRKLPNAKLYNMYGPTETTIWSTVKALEKNTQKIEIGKPIANTKIYILDKDRNLVPPGIQGEIYIGGEGVARGYTDKGLTSQSFIESPFVPGDRLYRTGDFGSWINNGSIHCSGRKDQQVKIRGYRIELGEIEQALLKIKGLNEAIVLAKGKEEKQLVAYITSNVELNVHELRLFLKEHLPQYMIPNRYVQLEQLPLNANGKVDKKLLPDPEGLELTSGVEYVGPRNDIEENLVEVWGELLQIERIGVFDDFFALGGHSLKATQLIIRAEKLFGVKVDLRNFLSRPTIDGLSEEIGTLKWMQEKSEALIIEGDESII